MNIQRKIILLCILTFPIQASAAIIVINPGVGFDDLTLPKVGQKGNNPGNNLGELRLNLFQEAANVWGAILNSAVTITVNAKFEEFGDSECTGTSIQLGYAGPTSTRENFVGGDPDIAYAVALAESLSGTDQNLGFAEIDAAFNSRVDLDPTCLGTGGGFYYGLDENAPDGTTALFATVLHEMGHGLGFLSVVTPDGSWLYGTMDPFSRLLKDLETGKTWGNMNDVERSNSLLNEPNLVWTGAQVTADRAQHLGPTTELVINAPAPPGIFDAALGQQSTAIPGGGLTRDVVDGNTIADLDGAPFDGCQQFTFTADAFAGKLVLFDKTDTCPVVFQILWAQREAAAGVMIASTESDGLADVTGLLNDDLTVPYIGIGKAEANQLRSNIGSANVTFQNSSTKLIGENQGMLKMYAPSSLEPGSSVSHWSKTASPDLLMEPSLGNLTYQNVDLTAAAFRDIGWSVNIPGGVVEEIYRDGFE